MNRLKKIFALILLTMSIGVFAQDGVAIGNWRTHMPYQKVVDVELFDAKVYAATSYELFVYDTTDYSFRFLNKINGLSDAGIAKIRRNEALDLLVVAYTNTNIDLIDRQGNIYNMSDIKDKTILGNKTINNVFFKDELAYFSCGFGIVVFDLSRREVKDTYYIGANGSAVNVNDIAIYNDRIYAATSNGLYYADADGADLANYSSWTFDNSLIHPRLNYDFIETFDNKLLVNYSSGSYSADTLFVYDGTQWARFAPGNTILKRDIRACRDVLLVMGYYNMVVYGPGLVQKEVIFGCGSSLYPLSAVQDTKGYYWIGDMRRGLVRVLNNNRYWDILPNGPYSKSVFELSSCGRHVWVATGGYAANWGKLYKRDGVCHFDGSWWTNLNQDNIPVFVDEGVSDFVCCATDPMDTTVTYVGTWGRGLLKFVNDEYVMRYDTTNSSLRPWTADPSLINVSGVAFDSKGNLWVANTGANNLLSVMDRRTGLWYSYNLGGVNSGIDIASMIIDKNDYKWILRRRGNDDKIIVFNDNGTLDDPTDDQVQPLRCIEHQGGISGSAVNCFAVDRNGYVWVGTDSGPCYFSDTRRIFNTQSYDANVILVPRNDGTNQADPLFNEVNVLSIAIDGNNNKWFGLESGVYELSPDCKTQLLNFNTDNSPLLDNSVNTMAINDDGEVFFGTNEGIISYRGYATPGGETNTDVVVYPNPVRPGYSGYVGIKGLVEDALVRITTVDGSFVTELVAEGGQAVWDCTTVSGQKVQPGIYLVFVSTTRGTERFVTKILIMN